MMRKVNHIPYRINVTMPFVCWAKDSDTAEEVAGLFLTEQLDTWIEVEAVPYPPIDGVTPEHNDIVPDGTSFAYYRNHPVPYGRPDKARIRCELQAHKANLEDQLRAVQQEIDALTSSRNK